MVLLSSCSGPLVFTDQIYDWFATAKVYANHRSFGTIEYRFSLTHLQITIKLYLNKITKVTVWHAINLCDLTPNHMNGLTFVLYSTKLPLSL